uniref:Cleavage stimulation factor 50 kDa subunit n=1 Tax=Elaeis guineensis var. tenera TaxID=51953 RepID=A0A6J0PJD7_ELAGV|nr:cleavage stimulation factor subunit 50 [Elaeis guineensis]
MDSGEIARPKVPAFDRTEINWDKLDKTKLYVVGAGLFTGVTVALYPISVIKTRMQVASKDAAQKNAFAAIRNILKVDGIPGLYRGFGTVITGAVPARIVFLTSLETTKVASLKLVEPFKLSEPVQAAIANGIAGMAASLCSQAVFVPIDVVSQRLMVQGYSGYAKYNGGLDVARKILKSDGVRGLYRGFGLSVMTYSPSSAVWWASYGSSQRIIWRLLGHGNETETVPSQWKIMCVQATGGVVAGAVASCITTPLDTIKTRLQVSDSKQRQTARQVVKRLIVEDGWKGFYRGLGPRFFSMSAWGTTMIVAYEYLSRETFLSLHIICCFMLSLVGWLGFEEKPSLPRSVVGFSAMESSLEQTLQAGKLLRHVNALIVAHLRDNNLSQAATAVASATMTPLNTEAPPNKLLELVAKGLAAERDEASRGVSSGGLFDSIAGVPAGHGSVPLPTTSVDFSSMQDVKGSSKSFPKHETRHVSEHKNVARCARFSPDGRFVATGSSDTSIKLFEVSKIKQMMLADARDGPVRPVIRTFYDHSQPINDLDFHPQGTILISGAKDHSIKFFDFSKTAAKRAFRVIQDTHNVRSVSFHPSGDYLLAGTDHYIPHLYDVNTFQCYLSSHVQELNANAAINQVQYSSTGSMYVTASKDGSVRVWDGVTAQCVRPIVGAHGSIEATSASFTKDQRFILSCGKDSTVKLWEVGTGRLIKQYLGAVHTQLRCQAVFNQTEEFILSIDEPNNEVVIWDVLTAEKVAKWPSNHIGAPRWVEHSPFEPAFITCGNDKSVRFWKEIL